MKVSEGLRQGFRNLEGGKKWFGGRSLYTIGGCHCAATAIAPDSDKWASSAEVEYLYRALPAWAKEPKHENQRHWEYVAAYNDDPRCEFRHISALYGKAIKLAEIDEAEAAGLVGKARLLRVALALREAKDTQFSMSIYVWSCGTPACAMGHYAARADLQNEFKIGLLPEAGSVDLLNASGNFARVDDQCRHFDITYEEWTNLFSVAGCEGAETAIQAADYIEKFAHAKWVTP